MILKSLFLFLVDMGGRRVLVGLFLINDKVGWEWFCLDLGEMRE